MTIVFLHLFLLLLFVAPLKTASDSHSCFISDLTRLGNSLTPSSSASSKRTQEETSVDKKRQVDD